MLLPAIILMAESIDPVMRAALSSGSFFCRLLSKAHSCYGHASTV